MSLEVLTSEGKCQKCGEIAFISNRKETICDSCFNIFMRGKLRKLLRSDVYKINSRQGLHKILLAFSGDVRSITCLDMIQDLLVEQQKNYGKTGFELVLVNIDEHKLIAPRLDELHALHDIEFKIVPLESFLNGKSLKRIGVDKKFDILMKNEDEMSIHEIIGLLPNKTSVEDFMEFMYDQILLHEAKELGCGTILYCNSMNKLSSSILANLIKGRGSNMNFKVNDTQKDGVFIKNPMRELFDNEIEYYAKINDLGKFTVANNEVISNINKNMTVKQITNRYLRNLESSGYASTIPTVVKITEKLVEPTKFAPLGECKICHEIIYQDPKEWLNKITVNEPAPLTEDIEREYLQQYLDLHQPDDNYNVSQTKICYGCMVSMSGASSIVWPQTDQEILDEYIIDDE